MTPGEADSFIRHAAGLWPEGPLGTEEHSAWKRWLCRTACSIEAAKAILDDVRMTKGRKRPPMATINKRLTTRAEEEARLRPRPQQQESRPNESRPGIDPDGYEHDCAARFRANPADPLFDRLRATMRRGKLTEVARRQWAGWFGTPTPYDTVQN